MKDAIVRFSVSGEYNHRIDVKRKSLKQIFGKTGVFYKNRRFPEKNGDSAIQSGDSFVKMDGPFGQMHRSFVKGNGSFVQMDGPFGQRNGSFVKRNGSFGQMDGPFAQMGGAFVQRDGSFVHRDGARVQVNGALV